MTAATLTEVIDQDRQDRPDWVVVARLIWGIDPGCVPTESEARAAVWIMYDQGYGQPEIIKHTGVSEKFAERIANWRRKAAKPPAPVRQRAGNYPPRVDYRALAPSEELRRILSGVRSHALTGIALPAVLLREQVTL